MFRGISKSKLDGKGRVLFPNKYRQALGDPERELVLTGHPAGCLALFELDTFLELEGRVMSLPDSDDRALYNKQVIVGYADQLRLDPYGRVLINAQLRQHARLDREVLMMGLRTQVRFWDEAYWNAFCERLRGAPGGGQPDGWGDFAV